MCFHLSTVTSNPAQDNIQREYFVFLATMLWIAEVISTAMPPLATRKTPRDMGSNQCPI